MSKYLTEAHQCSPTFINNIVKSVTNTEGGRKTKLLLTYRIKKKREIDGRRVKFKKEKESSQRRNREIVGVKLKVKLKESDC